MQLLEEFAMLEQRIICKLLPRNFDSLDQLIISPHPRLYKPLIQDITSIEFKIQQQKIIQQVKRTWLNIYYNAYEIKIQEYEEQYKENLRLFQFLFECKPNINRVGALNAMKTYLTDRRKRMLRQIHRNIVDYRKNLLKYRKRLSKAKKPIGVSPEPVFYLLYNPFNEQECEYLSRGKQMITYRLNFVLNNIIDFFRSQLYTNESKCCLFLQKTRKTD